MKAKCVKCYRWHVSIKRNTENYICPRCTAGIKKKEPTTAIVKGSGNTLNK